MSYKAELIVLDVDMNRSCALLSGPVLQEWAFLKGPAVCSGPKNVSVIGHANQRGRIQVLLLDRNFCELPAEEPRVRGKAIM